MAHGNFASARRGVAGKIRYHTRLLIKIDRKFADAGGMRILGRMHTVAPRVPFFTGWINRKRGIELLREAHKISKNDPRNALFLAEAIIKYQPENAAEARSLLKEAAAFSPDPDYLIEQSLTIDTAKKVLAELDKD